MMHPRKALEIQIWWSIGRNRRGRSLASHFIGHINISEAFVDGSPDLLQLLDIKAGPDIAFLFGLVNCTAFDVLKLVVSSCFPNADQPSDELAACFKLFIHS